jgi:NAD(P)-dependent dehydrogenase (short-subunit alcohol dehydrogenase family)
MSFSLQDKVALVTGGSRGIGKATALGFAEAGAHVAVASRKIEDLELVAAEISKKGRKSLAVAAHIGRLEDIDNLVKKVVDKFGRIDILVNNAGTSPSNNPLFDADERLWNVIINLNLKGLFFLSLAVAKLMKEHGGGSIINVSSVSGFMTTEGSGIYDISKAGVIMATKAMALEWAKYSIRVNCIAPGQVHTRLGDSILAFPEYEKMIMERTPMKHIAEPEEMVGAMIYLASDASSFVTGATIPVDGGILLM